jgi:hypothetical protein
VENPTSVRRASRAGNGIARVGRRGVSVEPRKQASRNRSPHSSNHNSPAVNAPADVAGVAAVGVAASSARRGSRNKPPALRNRVPSRVRQGRPPSVDRVRTARSAIVASARPVRNEALAPRGSRGRKESLARIDHPVRSGLRARNGPLAPSARRVSRASVHPAPRGERAAALPPTTPAVIRSGKDAVSVVDAGAAAEVVAARAAAATVRPQPELRHSLAGRANYAVGSGTPASGTVTFGNAARR